MVQTRPQDPLHCEQVGLDVPLDLEECKYSLSSESSVASFDDSEDDDHTLPNSINTSPLRAGQIYTFRHCHQVAPIVDVQPVIIQLVISQPPQNIHEIVQKIVTPLGFLEADSATMNSSKPTKPVSLYEIFKNPWDPDASADEGFSRKAARDWRRNFGAIHPTLVEEPVEHVDEDVKSQKEQGPDEQPEYSPSAASDDDEEEEENEQGSYTLANFRPTDSIRQASAQVPAIFFSDPRSSEIPEPWNGNKQGDGAENALPRCVRMCLWAFVLLSWFFVMLRFLPGIVSLAIETSIGHELTREPLYYRWVKAIMMGFQSVFAALLYVQSLMIFPFRVI